MPLYEYECEACGRRFELIRKFSDPPVESCPNCQGGPVRRLQSAPAIQFKGSGFYITDYARQGGESGKSEKSSQKSKDANSDGAAAQSSGSSDSKSDSTKTEKTESAPKPAASSTPTSGTKD